MKPTSTVDVEVILSSRLGDVRTVEKFVQVIQEKGGENAIVKAKGVLPYQTWLQINKAVREMGGSYKRRENLWLIPLNNKANI
jgi:methylmalonyl-CoA mutase cobalamin-binding subunit